MIVGVGTDFADGRRLQKAIEKHGEKIIARLFTPHERDRAARKTDPIPTFARIFAAKEATLKALGVGLAQGLTWQQIEIYREGNTPPSVRLSSVAEKRFLSLFPEGTTGQIHLSVSDDWPYALAFVVLSA